MAEAMKVEVRHAAKGSSGLEIDGHGHTSSH